MKRTSITCIALLIGLILLAGCMQAPAPADEPAAPPAPTPAPAPAAQQEDDDDEAEAAADGQVELMVTGIGFNLTDGMNPVTGQAYQGWETFSDTIFAERFPHVTLRFNTIPWENFRANMQTILQAGDTDLLYASANFVAPFFDMGLLMDLNPFMDADPAFEFANYYPAALQHNLNFTDFSTQHLVSMPFILGNRIIAYDRQIFDDFGVEYLPENPSPWDLLDRARRLTGPNPRTGEMTYGLWWDIATPNMAWFINPTYYFGAAGVEGSLADLRSLQWSLNSPEMVQTTEFLAELSQYTPPGFTTRAGNELWATHDNNIGIFFNGNGTLIMSYYLANGEPEGWLERWGATLNLGPQGEGWTVGDGIAMSTSVAPENRDVAWEVLKFLSGPETQAWWNQQFGPATMPSLDPSHYHPRDIFIPMNLRTYEHARSTPFEEFNPFFGTDIQPVISAIITNAASGIAVDIQAELDALQERAVAWSQGQ